MKINSMKVFLILSKNTEEYYIGYTDKKYLSDVLGGIIKKYKTFIKNNKKFDCVFNIIDKNDVYVEMVCVLEDVKQCEEYILEYKKNEGGCVSETNEITNNLSDVNIYHKTVDKKEYLKEYYKTHKDMYYDKDKRQKYYNDNKETIKKKSNDYYFKKKWARVSCKIDDFLEDI